MNATNVLEISVDFVEASNTTRNLCQNRLIPAEPFLTF